MSQDEFTLRTLEPRDEPFLREALYVALWDPPDAPRRPRSVLDQPRIAGLVSGWGRAGDIGFVAQRQADSEPIGAVWIRAYSPPPMGEEFLDDSIPHLGIAVMEPYQCRGVGTALMRHALDAARQQYPGVALTVHPRNPARLLYERFGFQLLGAVQAGYLVMYLNFAQPNV